MVKTTTKNSKLVSKIKSNELKKELESNLEDVRNRERAINSQEVITNNKVKEIKDKVIREMFKILEDVGVDPSDLESINAFLSRLNQTNPDLLRLFEITFNDLIGEQPTEGATPMVEPSTEVSENAGLMGKYKNLGQSMMMPRQ